MVHSPVDPDSDRREAMIASTRPSAGGTSLVGRGPTIRAASAAVFVATCTLALCATGSASGATRGRLAELSSDSSGLTYVASTACDVTASPCVTSPTEPVARFGLCELPRIRVAASPNCMAQVVIARIGGLYGP